MFFSSGEYGKVHLGNCGDEADRGREGSLFEKAA